MQHNSRLILLLLILTSLLAPQYSSADEHPEPLASTGNGVTVRGYLWNDSNCDGLRQRVEDPLNVNATGYQRMSLFYVGTDSTPFTRDDTEVGVAGAANGYPTFSIRDGGKDGIFYIAIRPRYRPTGYIPSLWQQGSDRSIDNDMRLWPDGAWATGTFVIPHLTGFAGGPDAVTGIDIGFCSIGNLPRPYSAQLPFIAR